ncbi:uncharacterized protein YGR130C-like [Pistacia vera]|uniref:uncharacterized protein YGR130C-like n=1 Tax=Pistacia vera TaxID=55513 RepID=UPI0012639E98|nr:uncharacterized protein YGR130C-like [Pistacia vera]
MIATTSKEGKGGVGEANDNLRTLECLRGRLIAERQASRAAKDDAELMGIKLIELENKLKEENKLRNKAEKKLKFLKKKLESLKIAFTLNESEQSSSSENSAHSCKSSSTSTSSLKGIEESESKSQITTPEISESIASNQSHESSSIQENSVSEDPPHEIAIHKSSSICQDSEVDNHSSETMKTSMEAGNERDKEEDYVDNSMAIVPVTFPKKSQETNELKIRSGSAKESLDALRLARERIQNSMERGRPMIRVGPS